MKVVLVISLGAILIWLYPEKPSMKDIKALPAVLSIKISMCGRGKVILRAFLVQVPKIHTHPHLPTLLRYGHDIGYPFCLVDRFDEPYL